MGLLGLAGARELVPWLTLFALVTARLGGLMATCQPLAPDALKPRFQVALVFWVGVAMSVGLGPGRVPGRLGLALLGEVVVGAAMGMVVRLGAVALSLAGDMVEMVVGFGFSQMVDPMSHDQAGPMKLFAQMMGAMTFFALGGQQLVFEAVAQSFRVVPPGQVGWPGRLGMGVVGQFSWVFVTALIMAAPLLAAALTTLLALALLTKVAPQLNIWSVGFLVTTSVSLAGLMWYLPSWLEATALMWRARIGAILPALGS